MDTRFLSQLEPLESSINRITRILQKKPTCNGEDTEMDILYIAIVLKDLGLNPNLKGYSYMLRVFLLMKMFPEMNLEKEFDSICDTLAVIFEEESKNIRICIQKSITKWWFAEVLLKDNKDEDALKLTRKFSEGKRMPSMVRFFTIVSKSYL